VTLDEARDGYSRFLAAHSGRPSSDPYFGEGTLRFVPRDSDLLLFAPGVKASRGSCGVVLEAGALGGELSLCGVSLHDAQAVVATAGEGRHARRAARRRGRLPIAARGAT